MVIKTVQLEFADPSIRAIDCIQDIRRAAENAGLNLYSRYNVQLQYPKVLSDDKVVVDIKIPETLVDSFAVGMRLRGISSFLLSRYEKRYKGHLVGKRLMNYIELSDSALDKNAFAMADRLEAIVSFTKLLERSDEEALDAIGRIMLILEENKQPWE